MDIRPEFEVEFPFWTLVSETALWTKGLPFAISWITRGGETCLPLFTDTDLAERFIEDEPLLGVVPLPLAAYGIFRGVLFDALTHSVRRIVIDASTNPDYLWRFTPIAETIIAIDTQIAKVN